MIFCFAHLGKHKTTLFDLFFKVVDFLVGVNFCKGFTQMGEILSKDHSTIVSFLGVSA